MDNPFDAFVGFHEEGEGSVPFLLDQPKDNKSELLWGDGVFRMEAPPGQHKPGFSYVQARGRRGWVQDEFLNGEPLLEVYFIDVGQGDGVLVRTPQFRHLLIDGGFPRYQQPTKKSAADFVDWKFNVDYDRQRRGKTVLLDAMIASHNDYDHYGGLDDLLDVAATEELRCEKVHVETFYHAGLSWWQTEEDKRTLGAVADNGQGQSCYVDLLGDRAAVQQALDRNAPQHLQGAWAELFDKLLACTRADGEPTAIERLSQAGGSHLPGFGPDTGDVEIAVLGPLEQDCGGRPGLRKFSGGDSKNTNGHSILLRLTWGSTRILVTGDLNRASQQDLLETHGPEAFACDVSKACHHGSDDVSFKFLQAMQAGATVISSGDAEGHDHPRPRIVAASGLTGFQQIRNDQLVTPLVYSTELARSYKLGAIEAARAGTTEWRGAELKKLAVDYKEHRPGSLHPARGHCDLHDAFVLAGLVYGLVNVRTDGSRIVCATLNEGKQSWSTRVFESRF